jgi:hypothetical protein
MARQGYSAKVDLRMRVGNRVIPLSQVGPTHVILEAATEINEPVTATIEVIINDRVSSTKQVFLHDGVRPDSRRVSFF